MTNQRAYDNVVNSKRKANIKELTSFPDKIFPNSCQILRHFQIFQTSGHPVLSYTTAANC